MRICIRHDRKSLARHPPPEGKSGVDCTGHQSIPIRDGFSMILRRTVLFAALLGFEFLLSRGAGLGAAPDRSVAPHRNVHCRNVHCEGRDQIYSSMPTRGNSISRTASQLRPTRIGTVSQILRVVSLYDGQGAGCVDAPRLTRITFSSSSLSAGFWKNAAAPAFKARSSLV